MKKILLIGCGAREHVIAEVLKRSKHEVELYVVGKMRNPGLIDLAEECCLADVCDLEAIRAFAVRVGVDFAVVGPEAPIEAGVVDMLLEIGVKSASPLQTVGRLESSKSFTRDLMAKYGIVGNPKFKTFFSLEGVEEFLEELGESFVIKADGLKGGKGVKVSGDHLDTRAEAVAYIMECLEDCGKVVVEEKFMGQEFSLMSFCDGVNTVEMPCIQDHKRAYEGDRGPNTGGMGTYSCENHLLPFLNEQDVADAAKITRKMAQALFEETGIHFKGIMYGGFMVTRDGVRLIEYNARFGDPEAMNALCLLKSDLVEIFEAMIEGTLDQVKVEFEKMATVCKYVVPEGYPDNAVKNVVVEIEEAMEEAADNENMRMYFASVDEREDGLYLAGSRAIAVIGMGAHLAEAEKIAEKGASLIKGPVFHRKDIGTAELVGRKVQMMKDLLA